MNRLFAVIGTPENGAALHLADTVRSSLGVKAGWHTIVDEHGLTVWHIKSRHARKAIHLVGKTGLVAGTVFRKPVEAHAKCSPIETFSPSEERAILNTEGRLLVDNYWGQYLAILQQGTQVWVIRDPSGSQSCYFTHAHGLVLVFTHFTDLLDCTSLPLTVNTHHLHAYLRLHFFTPSEETGFAEIRQLLAGWCLSSSITGTTTLPYWDAPTFVRASERESRGVAQARLALAVRRVVHSWAACHGRIYHELSGGLDSAIVLACLADAPTSPFVVCANYFTEGEEGDERAFAGAMAARVGVPFVEAPARNQERLTVDDFVDATGIVTPMSAAFTFEDDIRRSPITAQYELTALFSGQGGDQLFHRGVRRSDAADYLRSAKPRSVAEFVRILLSTARITRSSVWATLRSALYYGTVGHDSGFPPQQRDSFLRTSDMDFARQIHPWWSSARDLPPSKLLQLMSILSTQSYWERECPYADEIFPLLSQPLMECALSIPTYQLSHAGIDRKLIREAFATEITPDIRSRTTKGTVDSQYHNFIFQHSRLIRELLRGGLLEQAGFIDSRHLNSLFDNPESFEKGAMNWPVTIACNAEMWLRMATAIQHRAKGDPRAKRAPLVA